jgi:hypothetical protein
MPIPGQAHRVELAGEASVGNADGLMAGAAMSVTLARLRWLWASAEHPAAI